MHIRPSLLVIRSIGAEYANRLFVVVLLLFLLLAIGSLSLTIWLTTLSPWWWLLVALVIIALSAGTAVLIVFKLIIRTVRPALTKAQKIQTKEFVNKLERLSETAQTPKVVLLFRVIRDIAAPRDNGFIATLSSDTSSLKHDFTALSHTFK